METIKQKKEDKIIEIEKFLDELESFMPENFEVYKDDFKIRGLCERYFEKIIEAIIDLCFIIIREKGIKFPEDDKSSFYVLADNKIITKELAQRLSDAKGMRNIIAHEYGKINDEKVYRAIKDDLIKDTIQFLNNIQEI